MSPTPSWFGVFAHQPLLARLVAIAATDAIALSVLALIAVAWLHRDRIGFLIPFLIGAIVAAAFDLAAGRSHFELRPFAAMHVAPLVPYDPRDNSFPSDHSVATAYVASFLFFVDRRWALIAAVAALIVGVARVLALLHWPVDVLVGWAIGGWCGSVAGVIATRVRSQAS